MESVWRALSSPHRREIMDLLRSGPHTTGQISRAMPGLSRFAVMQHLQVLEEAHLVIGRRDGRSRLHFCNPARVRDVVGRWLDQHSMAAAETTLHLRRYVESETHQEKTLSNYRIVKIELELIIAADPDRVFRAVVNELDAWWPFRIKPDSKIVVDAQPGGMIEERFAAGGGAVYGHFMMLDRVERKFASSSPSFMNPAHSSFNEEEYLPHAEGTLVKKRMTLAGDVPQELEQMMREGMKQITQSALNAYVVDGIGYGGGAK